MSENDKTVTARQAALAVLNKAKEILELSDLAKAETGHEKGINTLHPAGKLLGHLGVSRAGGIGGRKSANDEQKDRAKVEHLKVLGEMKHISVRDKSGMGKSEEAPKKTGYGDVKPTLTHIEMASKPTMFHMKESEAHRQKAAIAHASGDTGLADKHGKMADMHDHYRSGINSDHKRIGDAGKLHSELSKKEALAKAEALLNDLNKSEYKTENKAAPSKAKELPAKKLEREFHDLEVKPGSSKDSAGKLIEKQVSPSKNPKKEAEGNNKPDGMEPRYEFKDKVAKELAKESKAHMDKAENPDKEQDAELGEQVEKDVEQHMVANKDAEQKERHEIMNKPGDKIEGETEKATIPRLILSAKLSKFMEHKHSKRKNAEAQAPAAVGSPAAAAPAPRSTQAGQPDPKKI